MLDRDEFKNFFNSIEFWRDLISANHYQISMSLPCLSFPQNESLQISFILTCQLCLFSRCFLDASSAKWHRVAFKMSLDYAYLFEEQRGIMLPTLPILENPKFLIYDPSSSWRIDFSVVVISEFQHIILIISRSISEGFWT